MATLLAADIGGTHARFAIARREPNGAIRLEEIRRLRVADFASLDGAVAHYRETLGSDLPAHAAIAVAGPVEGELLKLTNNPWVLRPALMAARLGFDRVRLVNDFEAVAHAVTVMGPKDLAHVAGPDIPVPSKGTVSVIGPGTGLGVAILVRRAGQSIVLPTEGGHMDFAPLDSLEDRILAHLRQSFRRVSVERIVAGPGLGLIRQALAAIEDRAIRPLDDAGLWDAALTGADDLARAALDRWCLSLGSVAGDLALAHWSSAVVLAGGILPRLGAFLEASGFHARFMAKGRFESHMARLPIRRITHPEPGLLGAAAAGFAEGLS
ncbi:glucokinase [Thermaurantiacus sp.]